MLASAAGAVGVTAAVLLIYGAVTVPAFIVGRRKDVSHPWIAFIPFVGAWIVILWSIERSGWLVLLGYIPVVSIVFVIWAAFTVPSQHGRTRWWALPFLLPGINLVAFWVYAFTLEAEEPPPVSAATAT
jgi:hypothetical protein